MVTLFIRDSLEQFVRLNAKELQWHSRDSRAGNYWIRRMFAKRDQLRGDWLQPGDKMDGCNTHLHVLKQERKRHTVPMSNREWLTRQGGRFSVSPFFAKQTAYIRAMISHTRHGVVVGARLHCISQLRCTSCERCFRFSCVFCVLAMLTSCDSNECHAASRPVFDSVGSVSCLTRIFIE